MDGINQQLKSRLGSQCSVLPVSSWTRRIRGAAQLGLRAQDFDTLCLVRIDGADVGRKFVETPPLGCGGLGLELEFSLASTFVEALLHLFSPWAKKLSEVGRPLVPPLDLLYVGGDDLQLSLPATLLPDLVASLHGTAPPQNRVRPIRWKIAAIEYPRPQGDGERAATPPEHHGVVLSAHWAHRNLKRLMEASKLDSFNDYQGGEAQLLAELVAPPNAEGWGLPAATTDAELPTDLPPADELDHWQLFSGPADPRWPAAFFLREETIRAWGTRPSMDQTGEAGGVESG